VTIAQAVPVFSLWKEPEGIFPRGTLIVVPGRGEHPGVYERFGRRVSADGYRVWAVADPTFHEEQVTRQVTALLADDPAGETGPEPRVLVGSDAGALFAAALVAGGSAPGVAGLVLAGLSLPGAPLMARTWDDEADVRTACPTHRRRLTEDDGLRRGALHTPPPRDWGRRADPAVIGVPVLGLHGADDAVAPLGDVRSWYAGLPAAELVSIAGGRHDALNDQTHRTAAATIVLFLERLRLGGDTPAIARAEILRASGAQR
jgi:alpha-beta hydrolase superfamily lysophospholipase